MTEKNTPKSLSASEAEEALAAVQAMTEKTLHSIATGGAYIFLIVNGSVWLVGFVCTQFLSGKILGYIWTGLAILAAAVSTLMSFRMAGQLRGPSASVTGKRIGLLWLFVILYGTATLAVMHPNDGKQFTMVIILLTMLGQLAMGLIISFASVWWALPITALALLGYFLFPGIYYLWMGIVVGGGTIASAFYIRSRW